MEERYEFLGNARGGAFVYLDRNVTMSMSEIHLFPVDEYLNRL